MTYSIIFDIKDIKLSDWTRFNIEHPQGNVFHSPEVFKAFSLTPLYKPVCVFAIDSKGEIVGLQQSCIIQEYKGFIGYPTARSITWGGPLVENNEMAICDELISKHNKTIKSRAIYSQIRNLDDISFFSEILNKNGYKYKDHLNIIVDLKKTEEELWSDINSKRRNEVKKAIKNEVTVELRNDRDSLLKSYQILKEVYKVANLPLATFELFKNLSNESNDSFRLGNFVALYEGEIIGCMFTLNYKKTIYNYYAGSKRKFYSKHPNDLIPWEVFKWGKLNDFECFDFGGAGAPGKSYGVRNYKMQFGGKTVNFGRYEKINNPLFYKIGTVGLKGWKLLRKLK